MAVRDAEGRVRSLGYRDEHVKLFIFTLSAVMAGIAGALYVPQVGIINPGEFAPLNSIELVIWVAVGGRGTLYGAAFGAILVNLAKSYLTAAFPEIWLFVLGALFVLVTIFLPHGIVGVLSRMRHKRASATSKTTMHKAQHDAAAADDNALSKSVARAATATGTHAP